ncbi:MAG: Stk1 family PASTA domain-containing Ser/Thr kinase [Bowdeniella nasicola]|nr:Stk1 family PASTA domain-containing Ser/Thr kinase [Bowdeniella nasicola]
MVEHTPPLLAGRYEIGELIGRGGMAEVHIGRDVRLSRRVAIKLLREDLARDPVFLARFRREAQSSAALNHQAIVAVYDTGEETIQSARTGEELQIPYIIMEYVEGHTVRDLLQEGAAVPIDEAVQIVSGVLGALDYAHRVGIVHRDIKPGNIMLTPAGDVKVMDFGIARAMADSQATMTQANAVVGTAQYLSPEQARGEVVDARSDLYSTGCLLFELLTGQPPFAGDSAVAIAYQHVRETPRTPSSIAPDIPEALDRVVLKSLAKDREQRYSDASEMRSDLLAAARGGTVSAPSTAVWGVAGGVAPGAATTVASAIPPTTESWSPQATHAGEPATSTQAAIVDRPRSSSRWVWGLLAFLVVILAVAAAYLVMNREKAPQEPPEVTVPELEGLNQRGVKNALEAVKLSMDIGEPVADDDVPEGLFVSSEPAPGATAHEGDTVVVHFSSGPGDVTVPDVKGRTQDEARQLLKDAGIEISRVESEDAPKMEKDQALRTDPEAGATIGKGESVVLYVATGLVDVEELKGMDGNEAAQLLSDLGLLSRSTTSPSNDVDPGQVVSQDPGPGKVPVGSTINLVIGTEPPPEETPEPPPAPSQDPAPTPSESGNPSEQPKD